MCVCVCVCVLDLEREWTCAAAYSDEDSEFLILFSPVFEMLLCVHLHNIIMNAQKDRVIATLCTCTEYHVKVCVYVRTWLEAEMEQAWHSLSPSVPSNCRTSTTQPCAPHHACPYTVHYGHTLTLFSRTSAMLPTTPLVVSAVCSFSSAHKSPGSTYGTANLHLRTLPLAQVSCMFMLLCPHQWVRGRWPWGYGSALSIITHPPHTHKDTHTQE